MRTEQEYKELESQASHWHEAYAKAEQEIKELKEGEYAQQKIIEYQQNRIEELEQPLL